METLDLAPLGYETQISQKTGTTIGLPLVGKPDCRLQNVADCPPGLLEVLARPCRRDMSDRYDKVGEDANVAFRTAKAKTMGVGFQLPKQLKAEDVKPRNRRTTSVQHTAVRSAAVGEPSSC